MPLDPTLFRQQFEVFRERVERKGRLPFVSFREGLPLDWEGYKEPLRQRALKRLGASTWQSSAIGTGVILRKLIAAIEVPKEGAADDNNLVKWRDEYGHRSRSHYVLLDAQTEPDMRRRIEAWAFSFFRQGEAPGDAFEAMRAINGSRYDLLAYLFFLADSDTYLPISSTTFDKAFLALGMNVKTAWKCSWSNYETYLGVLGEIRDALRQMPGLDDVRLLDAHSFCWLLVRPELERPDKVLVASAKGAASNAKIFSAIEKSVYEMVSTTIQTVRNANGQLVTVTKKVKELWMSKSDLEAYIKALIERQGGTCSLTGVPLQFRGEHDDVALLASLDRIDSSKDYEEGNLQVVCRFVNGWKSNTPDEEFRRLLSLVRGQH